MMLPCTITVGVLMIAGLACCLEPCFGQSAPRKAQLDETRAFFAAAPATTENRAARRERMKIIQAAADALTPEQFVAYLEACAKDSQRADALEEDGILHYLARSVDNVLADVRRTQVKRGVVVWHVYNMGYVFKMPDACFGADISVRDAARFAPVLDFLLSTHEHPDHNSPELITAMLKAGKPVLTRHAAGTTQVTAPGEYRFGTARVKVDIGDHHREWPNNADNMLMYQIDCGPAANGFVIYHSGDGNNYRKMQPDKPVDLFIMHVAVGMNVEEAIHFLKPKFSLGSHVLELAHSPKPPQAWRWSFNYAFNTMRNISADQYDVLTWGERWLAPGTELQE